MLSRTADHPNWKTYAQPDRRSPELAHPLLKRSAYHLYRSLMLSRSRVVET